jgi:outer membrane protein OmpA-like peptidoglycan-associated protein
VQGAPAAAAEKRSVHLLFFDYQQDAVAPEASPIIQQAYNSYTKYGKNTGVEVIGHTDTAEHNQELSEQRARNVAQILVKLGVPSDTMTVRGRGDKDLRKSTPPNTREPQNRRVEIIISQ